MHHPLLADLACSTAQRRCLALRDKMRRLAHATSQAPPRRRSLYQERPRLYAAFPVNRGRRRGASGALSDHRWRAHCHRRVGLPDFRALPSESKKRKTFASGHSTYRNSTAETCTSSRARSSSTHSKNYSTDIQTAACAIQKVSTTARSCPLAQKLWDSKASSRDAATGPTAPSAAIG
jgi:hypothetical protein